MRQRYQKQKLAYAFLKQLGVKLDHLPVRYARASFSHHVLKEHFPGALPTEGAIK